MGGLISLYAFFHAPETFGFAGVMSPSLWIGDGAIYADMEAAPCTPGKIYLDNGTREPSARRMNALLLKKGYQRDVDLKYVVEAGRRAHRIGLGAPPAGRAALPDSAMIPVPACSGRQSESPYFLR